MINLQPVFPSQDGAVLSSYSPENPHDPLKRWGRTPSQQKKTRVGNRLLMVGRLRELALYRAEVLKQAGFQVFAPRDLEEAFRVMQRGEFDAIIVSYTLPNDTVQYVMERAREHCPDCPIIAIRHTETEDRLLQPDAIALADHGPDALIAAVQTVLRPS